MQCPKCQSPIEASPGGGGPLVCKTCGTSVAPTAVSSPSRGLLRRFFAPLLILLLAAFSAGATVMALRTADERTRAKEELADVSLAARRMFDGDL